MFERHHEPLLPRSVFVRRLVFSALLAIAVIAMSLGMGMLGYHYLGDLPWLDSFMNAAMILSGMGPVDELHSGAAKLFAGCYALFSGIVFLTSATILLAPLAHRMLHHFHLRSMDNNRRPS